jgi:hypothetical protein
VIRGTPGRPSRPAAAFGATTRDVGPAGEPRRSAPEALILGALCGHRAPWGVGASESAAADPIELCSPPRGGYRESSQKPCNNGSDCTGSVYQRSVYDFPKRTRGQTGSYGGSSRCRFRPHTVEVTGSNPVTPRKIKGRGHSGRGLFAFSSPRLPTTRRAEPVRGSGSERRQNPAPSRGSARRFHGTRTAQSGRPDQVFARQVEQDYRWCRQDDPERDQRHDHEDVRQGVIPRRRDAEQV